MDVIIWCQLLGNSSLAVLPILVSYRLRPMSVMLRRFKPGHCSLWIFGNEHKDPKKFVCSWTKFDMTIRWFSRWSWSGENSEQA